MNLHPSFISLNFSQLLNLKLSDHITTEKAIFLPKKLRQLPKKTGNQRQRIREIKEKKGILPTPEGAKIAVTNQTKQRRQKHAVAAKKLWNTAKRHHMPVSSSTNKRTGGKTPTAMAGTGRWHI